MKKKLLLLAFLIPVLTQAQTIVTRARDDLSPFQMQTINQNGPPKFSFSQMRAVGSFNDSVIHLYNYNGTIGSFKYDPTDTTTPDDSAMCFVASGKRYKRQTDGHIDARWFGAVPNDPYDDYAALQRAIDYAVYNSPNRLEIPAGYYYSSHGLDIWKDANNDGNPEFVYTIVEGAGIAYAGGTQETRIIFTDNEGFGLNIQRGKGCEVNNLTLQGQNTLNYSVATAWAAGTTYVVNGCRSNMYTPYAGLNIDRWGYVPTEDDKDPTDPDKGENISGIGGSTDCKFNKLVIEGWVAGIILSPNAQTANNESHVFDGVWISNCRDGFVTGNSQERVVICNNFKIWNSVQTCFRTTGYGLNRGDVPKITNLNVAGNIFQLFVFSGSGGYFPNINIRGVHAESFYRIGHVSGQTVRIEDFHFNFGDPSYYGQQMQDWIYEGSYTEFNNGVMIYYIDRTNIPLRFKNNDQRKYKFENVIIGAPVSFHTGNVMNEDIISNFAQYKNVNFYNVTPTFRGRGYNAGTTNRFGSDLVDLYDVIKQGSTETFVLNTVTTPINRLSGVLEGGGTAVTVTGDSASFTSSNLASLLSVGDAIHITGASLTSKFGEAYTDGQIGKVRRIEGSVVTLEYVTDGMVTGTYYLRVSFLQELKKGFVANASSTTKLVYTSGTKPNVGDRIANGYKVTSVVADSVFIYPAFPVTQDDLYFNTYEHTQTGQVYGDPAAATISDGIICRQGTILANTKPSDAAKAWLCTKTGTFGSAHPPEFVAL